MPLPTSGVISFGNFETEFAGSGVTQPIGMGQMYRNTGPYVEDIIIQTGTTEVITYTGDWDPPEINGVEQYYQNGPLSVGDPFFYYWSIYVNDLGFVIPSQSELIWNGQLITQASGPFVRINGFEYDRGIEYSRSGSSDYYVYYSVRRRPYILTPEPVYTNLNGDVPTAGVIRMSNMRGARDSI
jgi:hypothetical protein